METLIGNEVLSSGPKHTQTFLATHDGEGKRLPYMNRSFISFSYGGKPIEDFNLIVTFNDRLEKNAYAEFEDTTSEYETLDGQYYWGTHFKANQLNFTLSTDGMTQQNLDDFKRYFIPGVERELILAEHPNRAIMARVSAAPSMSFLPFEELVTVRNTQISTTLYKGSITLTFTMDDPFWYGRLNYIPEYIDRDSFEEKNEQDGVATQTDKDFLKIYLEDGVPFKEQLENSNVNSFLNNKQIVINGEIKALSNSNGVDVDSSHPAYLFYTGSAPSKPIIQFDMAPLVAGANDTRQIFSTDHSNLYMDSSGTYYTDDPNKIQVRNGVLESSVENQAIDVNTGNIITATMVNESGEQSDNIPFILSPVNQVSLASNNNKYSYIRIQGPNNEESYFYFTTPGIWTGYNKAISLISNSDKTDSLLELKEHMRDEIKEYYSRAWALKVVDDLRMNRGVEVVGEKSELFNKMKEFLNESYPATFTFDTATGEATGIFSCLDALTGESTSIKENVGDMVKSPYLIIREKSKIELNDTIDSSTCYEITSNESLTNFKIYYKNMYL